MAKTKEQKKKIIADLRESIDSQKAAVFIDFTGLKSKDFFALRRKLKAADCLCRVAKKTLLNLVLKEKKTEVDLKKLEGELALVFGFGDEMSPAKIVYQFSKEKKLPKILGGFFEGKWRSPEEIIAIAQLPGREELLAKLVGGISAPVSNFVGVLQAPLEACVFVIKAFGKSKMNK